MTILWFIELITIIGCSYLCGYLLGMFMHSACLFNGNPLKRLLALVFIMLFSAMLFGKFAGIIESFIAEVGVAQ